MIALFFTIYHRIVARPKGNAKIADPKFVTYFRLAIPPASQGLGLALIPVMIADILIAIGITGRFFDYTFYVFDCTEQDDAACARTLFDQIKDDPGSINVNYQDLRTGRCGTAFLVVGIYLLAVGLMILVPDQSDPGTVPESYDGNVWEFYSWKRSNMVFVSTWLIFLSLIMI